MAQGILSARQPLWNSRVFDFPKENWVRFADLVLCKCIRDCFITNLFILRLYNYKLEEQMLT